MNEELQKLKEEFEQQIKELEEEFEARLQTLKEEYKECELEKGEIYWSILEAGNLVGRKWLDTEYDKKCYKIGNAFQTKEEAEFLSEKLKVIKELKQLARPFKPEVSNWLIQYDNSRSILVPVPYTERIVAYGDFYFDGQKESYKAVEKIGEDRINKYLFGVKEGDNNGYGI